MNPDDVSAIDSSEIPEGFSAADPNAGSGGGGGQGGQKGPTAAERQAQVEDVLSQVCDAGALERLKRIKIVRKDKANAIEQMLVQAAMSGKLPGKITEARLIEMLEQMDGEAPKAKVAFARKNYGLDSDDEDDNDDDLM